MISRAEGLPHKLQRCRLGMSHARGQDAALPPWHFDVVQPDQAPRTSRTTLA